MNLFDQLVKNCEIHIVALNIKNIENITSILGYLSPKELELYKKIADPKVKKRFACTRTMLRNILARYLSTPTQQLIFLQNKYGKPFISNELSSTKIHFNAAHSNDIIICAFNHRTSVGIDIEYVNYNVEDLLLESQHILSPDELQYIKNLPYLKKLHIFYKIWTVKEAHLKRIGVGITGVMSKVKILSDLKNVYGTVLVESTNSSSFILPLQNLPYGYLGSLASENNTKVRYVEYNEFINLNPVISENQDLTVN